MRLNFGLTRVLDEIAHERGQTIVLFAFSMIAMLGFMALVVDVAVIFEERRQLQNAADGAALAAARELPGSPGNAVTAAHTYLTANGYDPSDADVLVQIDTTYLGDPEDVEVVVTQQNLAYLFGRIIGLGSTDVSARAVSEIVSAYDDDYAIFAIDDSCSASGVDISGSVASFNGTVHANANVTISGTSHTFDPSITYQCGFTENGSGHSYQRDQKSTGARDVPATVAGVNFSSFGTCDFNFAGNNVNLNSKPVWQNPQKTILMDGLYCFSGGVSLVGNDIQGKVTFAAMGNINVSGSGHLLEPYHSSGILFYSESSTGPMQINIAGSGGQWTGLIYAANGDASLSGQSNQNFEGSVIAQNVAVSGTGMTITASQLANNGNPVVRIIE